MLWDDFTIVPAERERERERERPSLLPDDSRCQWPFDVYGRDRCSTLLGTRHKAGHTEQGPFPPGSAKALPCDTHTHTYKHTYTERRKHWPADVNQNRLRGVHARTDKQTNCLSKKLIGTHTQLPSNFKYVPNVFSAHPMMEITSNDSFPPFQSSFNVFWSRGVHTRIYTRANNWVCVLPVIHLIPSSSCLHRRGRAGGERLWSPSQAFYLPVF